jgi:cytoskeletal protein CcmA (bactofilin family)
MDNQNQPILENNSLETTEETAAQTGVVDAPSQTPGSPGYSGFVTQNNNEPQQNPVKRILEKINLYFILLIVVLLILGGVSYYAVLQNRKSAKRSDLKAQTLSQDTFDKLAGTDSTVGDARQTLTIASNAIFSGALLVRGNIDIAGTIKVGGSLSLPSLSVGGSSTLEQVAAKSLTVAGDEAVQGKLTVQGGLVVTGSASFSGAISAPQVTIDTLTLNKDLLLNKHVVTNGSSPNRVNGGALGSGGTVSINGTDTAGTININTGNSAPAGCFITITFATPFAATPHVIISPSSSASATFQYYTTRTNTGFSLCSANVPPSNSANIIFDYIVIG